MTPPSVLAKAYTKLALTSVHEVADRRAARKLKQRAPATHLERALNLARQPSLLDQEPIRTIHHLSCTGGTLITKCIASMANTVVLNEIDPHSSLPFRSKGKPPFTPTDMVALLRQGDRHVPNDLITRLFLSDLELIREEYWQQGQDLVLRDHSHSHFLTGDDVADHPTLLESIASRFPTRSILTVRDPIDSWLSMEKQGWHKLFSPSTFEEYCRRYILFLEKHEGIPIVKYEDFVAEPKVVMQRICDVLELTYFDGFEEVFSAMRFSGDSGRGGRGSIKKLPQRELAKSIESSAAMLPELRRLLKGK